MKISLLRQIVRMTKYALFGVYIQFFLSGILLATDISAQQQSIEEIFLSVNMEDQSLEEFFSFITKKTKLNFHYNRKVVSGKKVTIHQQNASLGDLLRQISKTTRLTFKRINETIHVSKNSILDKKVTESYIVLQDVTISGRVTSAEDNEGLPGVNVFIKGTTRGTVTDINGAYHIDVPSSNSVLVYSSVGYISEEIAVGNNTVIDVNLFPDLQALEEVVVVAYGTQKEYSVVGSITTIEPQKLQSGTTRSLSNNLAGQLAGIIAVQRSGEPGYDNSNFWIRGISTFAQSRNPMVLVDGVERSLNDIDPAEIASFSILKDAAASAVYGVRGANGVILINTKRGKVGRPTIDFRYEQGVTRPVQLPDFLGAAEYLEVLNSIAEESGELPPYAQESIDNIRNGSDPDLYSDVNWLDAITKDHASNSRVNLSVAGGSDVLRYSLVGSFYGEQGIIDRDKSQEWDSSMKLRRYNIRSNVDLNVTSSTLFRVNIGGYLQDEFRPPQSIDHLFAMAFETPPFVHPMIYSSGEIPVVPERSNPWALATQTGYERRSASKLESLFSIEQDLDFLLSGMKARFKFAFDRYSKNGVIRSKTPDYYNPAVGRNDDGTLDLVIYQYGQDFLGHETSSEWGDKSVYLEGNLSYTKNFAKHYVDALFLYNQRNYDNGNKLPFRNQGIAGRFSYSFDHRYIAEFNFGYNGSENFAQGQRFGFFPSFAVGWLLSEEQFMSSVKNTFDKVKIRASHGLVGNDRIDGRRFAYITTIGDTHGYRWGVDNDYYRAGRREGDYGVDNLTWETVTKSNIGFELGLFSSIDLQVDVFKEQRKDIFMQRRTVPGSSGFINTPWANYGKVDNAGVDVSLDINRQITQDLNISVWGTFTYAENKIIEQDEPSTVKGTNRSSTGKPVGQIFGLVAEGLFTDDDFSDIESGELIESIPSHTFGPVRPGDIKYKDINDDGVINDLDRTAIGGTADPQIVYGFGLNMKYRNVDFGVFFQGNGRTDRIIGGSNFIPGSSNGALGNYYSNVDDRWTIDNPDQDVFWPRLSNYQHANNNQASTWWLRDMSMLRMKNVEIGYNFSQGLLEKASIKNARIFLRGDNLLTFSGFNLWDPELDTHNGFRYPIMKSISVGMNVNF
ncbi:MAG: TonB-dependent receptor [Cytophagales bacterium]|nr:TonB-dependent receptor [Cytophagales bacterium]